MSLKETTKEAAEPDVEVPDMEKMDHAAMTGHEMTGHEMQHPPGKMPSSEHKGGMAHDMSDPAMAASMETDIRLRFWIALAHVASNLMTKTVLG